MSRKEAISREVAFFVLFVLAVGLSVLACNSVEAVGSSGRTCKASFCGSFARGTVSTTLSPADIPGAKVVACRNDDCNEGTIEKSTATRDGGDLYVCTFPSGGPYCEGTSIGSLVFTFTLPDGAAKAGDTYSFKVIAKDGAVKGEKSGVASYRTSQPNGSGCEPTCSQAEL